MESTVVAFRSRPPNLSRLTNLAHPQANLAARLGLAGHGLQPAEAEVRLTWGAMLRQKVAWGGRVRGGEVQHAANCRHTAEADAALTERIRVIHERLRETCRMPRIHAELAKGLLVGRQPVARLMRAAGMGSC